MVTVIGVQRAYEVSMTQGFRFYFLADLTEASAPLFLLDDDGSRRATPWQTADVRHDEREAAALFVGSFGGSYWDDSKVRSCDPAGFPLYDGMTEEAYIDSVIESVEAVEV